MLTGHELRVVELGNRDKRALQSRIDRIALRFGLTLIKPHQSMHFFFNGERRLSRRVFGFWSPAPAQHVVIAGADDVGRPVSPISLVKQPKEVVIANCFWETGEETSLVTPSPKTYAAMLDEVAELLSAR